MSLAGTTESSQTDSLSRRRFLQQSFGFSAVATLGSNLDSPDSIDSFTFSQSEPKAAHLLLFGDWGYENPAAQTRVAAALRGYIRQHAIRPQALLLLGDNWYGELAGGAHSPRWQTHFEQMYPPGDLACPAYAVLGNHDYERWPESKVDAELEYARIGRNGGAPTRWTMPARWYRFSFPAKNPLITFLALDSNVHHHIEWGRDFALTPQQQAEQLAWLQTELERPRTTPFLAAFAHHPLYSNGPHGDHPTLIRDWDPLFRKYHVDLYMAGHDHDLQHLEFAGHPTSHFLSGGGGADVYSLRVDPAQRGPFAKNLYGFSHISVDEQRMTLRHVDENGTILHAFTRTAAGQVAILG